MSSFSKEELEKIDELRKRVSSQFTNPEEQQENEFLIRWLRARNMDVDKAEEMLSTSLKWRKETGADTILERDDFPEKYKKKFMFANFGEDDEGHPIVILPAGRHNHRMILEAEGMEACLRWNIVWIEKIMKIIKDAREKSGKPVYTYHEIIDMEHYSFAAFTHKPAVEYIVETQKMFDANYPDILKSCTVINAPKIFSMLFNVLKPLIAKETLEKLTIYGCDEDEWKESFVKKGFPMHKLPPRWGGTRYGVDEFCSKDDVWFDAPIPLEYFKEVPEEDDDGFYTARIGARDKLELLKAIPEPTKKSENNNEATADATSIITWKFKTEGRDINLQINFISTQDGSFKEEVILPPRRVESQAKLQEGSYKFKCGGTCKFIFDNRYSTFSSKTLKYKIYVQ